jgi:hypothetical protein
MFYISTLGLHVASAMTFAASPARPRRGARAQRGAAVVDKERCAIRVCSV